MSLYDLLPSFSLALDGNPSPSANINSILAPFKSTDNAPTPTRQLRPLSLAPGLTSSQPESTVNTSLTRVWSDVDPERSAGLPRGPHQLSSDSRSVTADNSNRRYGLAPGIHARRERRRPQSVYDSGLALLTTEETTPASTHELRPRPSSLSVPSPPSHPSEQQASTPTRWTTHTLSSSPSPSLQSQKQHPQETRSSAEWPLTFAEKHGDLLRAIAHQEAKVNAARQELASEEKELQTLKAEWAIVIARSYQHPSGGTAQDGEPSLTRTTSATSSKAACLHRPQPANAARLLPSPSRLPADPSHPLTRTASNISNVSTVSGQSFGSHASLQALQTASNSASSLVSQRLANIGIPGVSDLAHITGAAAGGKVVEGGRRFVGHMWDALQGVAEGVVMSSPGQGVESESAKTQGKVESRGMEGQSDLTSPLTPSAPGTFGQAVFSGFGSIGYKTANTHRTRQTSSKAPRELFCPLINGPVPTRAAQGPESPRQAMSTTGTIRNIRNLSLVSSSTERAMDTAFSDQLVDLDPGEGLSDKLEGMGFVPLSPKKASPRRSQPENESPIAVRDGKLVTLSPSVQPINFTHGRKTSANDVLIWTARLADVVTSPAGKMACESKPSQAGSIIKAGDAKDGDGGESIRIVEEENVGALRKLGER